MFVSPHSWRMVSLNTSTTTEHLLIYHYLSPLVDSVSRINFMFLYAELEQYITLAHAVFSSYKISEYLLKWKGFRDSIQVKE